MILSFFDSPNYTVILENIKFPNYPPPTEQIPVCTRDKNQKIAMSRHSTAFEATARFRRGRAGTAPAARSKENRTKIRRMRAFAPPVSVKASFRGY